MKDTFLKLIYATFPNIFEAQRICTALVEAELAACVNLLPGHQSIYRWEGNIRQDSEVVALIKTRDHNVDTIQEHIKNAHPFAIPCILVIDITGGNPAFLNWVCTNSQPSKISKSDPLNPELTPHD